ncbi:hypothetical protein [Trueperella pyogenes]|uniref:hypothetical protein n=1 Tax=Trueperella pyogenes TaxID=1661 RepID=UPI00345D3AB0
MMYLLVMGSISLAGQSFNDQWVATQFPRWIVSGVGTLTGVAIRILALANIIRMIRGKTIEELLTPTNDDSAEALYKDGDTNNSDVIIAAIERFERAGKDQTIAWNGEEK